MDSAPPTSIQAWNGYMKQFIAELCETFPECNELFAIPSAMDAKIAEDEYGVLYKYVDQVEPYVDQLTNKDERFFLTAKIEFLENLGIRKYWTLELEEETKNAIWKYLQTLLVMARTILTVPPQMLSMLEKYASSVTNRMMQESGEAGAGRSAQQQPPNLDIRELGQGALDFMFAQDPNLVQSVFARNGAPASGATQLPPDFKEMFTAAMNNANSTMPVPFPAPTAPQNATAGQGFNRLQQMLKQQCATAPTATTPNPGLAALNTPQTFSFTSGPPTLPPFPTGTPAQTGKNIWTPPAQPLYGGNPPFGRK